MMQPAGGMVQPSMVPPTMEQQQQPPPQQWGVVPPPAPQYHQGQAAPPPPPMWNQQPSQIPPPVPQAFPPAQSQMAPQYPVPTAAQPVSSDEIRTLWIGDLQYWMDETYLQSCFYSTGQLVSAKVIRNKQSGQSEGYGFIEFSSRAAAEAILQNYSGQLMPQAEQVFRLNWATYSAGERRADDGADYTIFVGDLAVDVTDFVLQEIFKSHYPSVKGAKVVTDRITGRSKGYGFVRFGDANEQTRAMTEMNGMLCSTRPMRIGPATNKKTVGAQQQYPAKASYQTSQATQSDNDPNNTTIFVGGVDSTVTDDVLRQLFGPYGELINVKIPVGKRCAFVQFASRASAEEALVAVQGTQLAGQSIRLSWGRSPSSKQQSQQDPNQWNGGGYYGYGQGYEAYGYGQPPQDPNMYAYGTYQGYTNYQQQQ
ncbi:Apoptosis-promoting RNA-binding protein TIA-1/TIAR (RRM superfamily) protein [Dioscorea alata]|uniref:Apoptosis-promoting RNA-binding protein TIA-1/TIAR (RRM superfamily) protein n=1 Tax=Dioscorea alata TaxID=55571 RepID=A0ACB7TW67_DIOAL|nr:Apoptosis-promoting RNA-binding protein TIA-1/TIAR (RRM superfamily) protein [Dioscorea alata]